MTLFGNFSDVENWQSRFGSHMRIVCVSVANTINRQDKLAEAAKSARHHQHDHFLVFPILSSLQWGVVLIETNSCVQQSPQHVPYFRASSSCSGMRIQCMSLHTHTHTIYAGVDYVTHSPMPGVAHEVASPSEIRDAI